MSDAALPHFSVLNPANRVPEFSSNTNPPPLLPLPEDLAAHPGFARIFRPGGLTFGVMAPFKGYPDSAVADSVDDLAQLAQCAEKLGYAALWVRDVPFFDQGFGDAGQIYDPMITLGYLAAHTYSIALASGGLIAPLRSPVHIAKAAASLDALTKGRFVLGLSSGDRALEYAAFGADHARRAQVFRESREMIHTLLSQDYPHFQGAFHGELDGSLDLLPKVKQRMPIVAVGRARQELPWLANTADAWIWHGVNPKNTVRIVNTLAELGDGKNWHPFGCGVFVEVEKDRNAPVEIMQNIHFRGGARQLAEFWAQQRAQGLAHVVLNLKPSRRPAAEILQELAEETAQIC